MMTRTTQPLAPARHLPVPNPPIRPRLQLLRLRLRLRLPRLWMPRLRPDAIRPNGLTERFFPLRVCLRIEVLTPHCVSTLEALQERSVHHRVLHWVLRDVVLLYVVPDVRTRCQDIQIGCQDIRTWDVGYHGIVYYDVGIHDFVNHDMVYHGVVIHDIVYSYIGCHLLRHSR